MNAFHVELKRVVDDSYDIEIGYALKARLVSDIRAGLVGGLRKFAIITDSNVEALHAREIAALLADAGYSAEVFVFPAGETSKTRRTKEEIEDAMLARGMRRDCCVIAVGGGVVTDLAGFVAGTFGRGVPFINYATTLLAAADASIGGKTAVDTPLATNLIGLFNQPRKVYIDIEAWKTLPRRQIASGMAETVKHALLSSRTFFDDLCAHMEDIFALERTACERIAQENCRVKYEVVMQDERESGLREILNLGHTVGRAVETVSGYRLLHGEAVSIGLVAQARLSCALGYMNASEVDAVTALLKRAELPVRIPDYIDREALVKKLYTDKKVRDGRLRFVLEKGIGGVMEFDRGVYALPVEEAAIRPILAQM